MVMSRSATRPAHPIRCLILPEPALPTVDECLQGEQGPELKFVLRMFPGVAWFAGGDEILDPVGTASG